MLLKFTFLVSGFLYVPCRAQTLSSKYYGASIGLHVAAGTHFDRVGISCSGYYIDNTFQLNPGFRIYYNFRNIGPSIKYFEFAPSVGVIISYGKNDSLKNYFLNAIENQTLKRNSVGYAFNYYLNHIKTSQATGTVSFQWGKFQIACEDDLFAGGIRDEFRTGSFLAQYRDAHFQYGINFFTGWTGKRGIHTDDPNYPSRNGYMDMSHSLYGNVSAGLLSAQIQYAAPYGQILQCNVGIDAERVRHFFQNELVHELLFSPKNGRWRGGSDLPMIDREGKMYLYKKDQHVKSPSLYLNIFINPNIFY